MSGFTPEQLLPAHSPAKSGNHHIKSYFNKGDSSNLSLSQHFKEQILVLSSFIYIYIYIYIYRYTVISPFKPTEFNHTPQKYSCSVQNMLLWLACKGMHLILYWWPRWVPKFIMKAVSSELGLATACPSPLLSTPVLRGWCWDAA